MSQQKIKRGTQRSDGLYFICYQKNGSEYWAEKSVLDACMESARAWKRNNRERVLASMREYGKKNRKSLNEKRKVRWIKNPDGYKKYIESQRDNRRKAKQAYNKRNPWRKCADQAVRRSKIKPNKKDLKLIKEIYACCSRISKCTGIPHHVDHIIPLCLGGQHSPNNLQVLPASINIKKGGRLLAGSMEVITKDVTP